MKNALVAFIASWFSVGFLLSQADINDFLKVQEVGNEVFLEYDFQAMLDSIDVLNEETSAAGALNEETSAAQPFNLEGGTAYFIGLVLDDVDLTNANMTDENGIYGFDILHLGQADLTNSTWQNQQMGMCYFSNVNLSSADFSGAHFGGLWIDDTYGGDFNLSGAYIHGDFRDFHLPEANFSGAYFSSVIFDNSDVTNDWDMYEGLAMFGLPNANFTDAFLESVEFSNVDLSNADFTGASFVDVYWTGSFIEGCTGCDCIDVDGDNYCD